MADAAVLQERQARLHGGRRHKALIGFTGTVCILKQYPSCFTNNDPAAILDSGKSFSTLWSQSLTSPANVYSLSPAIKFNGNWYAYTVNDSIENF